MQEEKEEETSIALRKTEVSKIVKKVPRDLLARLLVVFKIDNTLTDQKRAIARKLLKILTERFLAEVLSKHIQNPEELINFSEIFFSKDSILYQMKKAKIKEVVYSTHSKFL